MKRLMIRHFTGEEDYKIIKEVSVKRNKFYNSIYPNLHIGNIGFRRYFSEIDSDYIYSYCYLVYEHDICAGFFYSFTEDEECEIVLELLPEYEEYYDYVIEEAQRTVAPYYMVKSRANAKNTVLCRAFLDKGYLPYYEKRYEAVLDLKNTEITDVHLKNEFIYLLKEKDIDEKIKYFGIPFGGMDIRKKDYIKFMKSEDYKNVSDYIIRDINDEFMGYFMLWMDNENHTALLEPVAMRLEYRKKGIMRNSLLYIFNQIKLKGIEKVYVCTNEGNINAVRLYEAVGFIRSGQSFIFLKKEC